MKFSRKKMLLISTPLVAITPAIFAISCSKTDNTKYDVSENNQLYSNLWLLQIINEIDNTVFDMTVQDLEDTINNSLKKDSKNNLIMKLYCFYLLWNGIKSPYTSDGNIQPNLSTDINDYSSMLTDKLKADDEDEENESKKTYKNLKKYIESFDYRLSIINFENGVIDKTKTINEIFASDMYVLNFKIDFWTSDEETNSKMVSKKTNRSIMFKTSMTTEQRKIVRNISNPETKQIAQNQFTYQSTKIYYDVENKKFSTIILPSNINYLISESTVDSGFAAGDKQRNVFSFNWYSSSEGSNNFNSFLTIRLNETNNFSTSLNTNWTNFLMKEGIIDSDKKMDVVKINLNKSFSVSSDLLEEDE